MKHVKLFEQFINEAQEMTYRVKIKGLTPNDIEKAKEEIKGGDAEVSIKVTGKDEKTMFISGKNKQALSKIKGIITKTASKGEVSTEELKGDKWAEVGKTGAKSLTLQDVLDKVDKVGYGGLSDEELKILHSEDGKSKKGKKGGSSGANIQEDPELFKQVIQSMLDYLKENPRKYDDKAYKIATKGNLTKWLKNDIEDNPDSSYSAADALDGFFEYMDN
jgi:uncharacterized protein YajQ (UPF0234 family)